MIETYNQLQIDQTYLVTDWAGDQKDLVFLGIRWEEGEKYLSFITLTDNYYTLHVNEFQSAVSAY